MPDALTERETVERETEKIVHERTIFGFWVYIMSDAILFASLFAAYGVLHDETFGGPSARQIFSLPYTLGETLLLLTSSFTSGLAGIAAERRSKWGVIAAIVATFFLGLGFVAMEAEEFTTFARAGYGWNRSAFLSSFFTLVGTHGTHVSIGLLWMLFFLSEAWVRGLTPVVIKRLSCLRLFWHFLDVVWIFIFTVVYLMGVA